MPTHSLKQAAGSGPPHVGGATDLVPGQISQFSGVARAEAIEPLIRIRQILENFRPCYEAPASYSAVLESGGRADLMGMDPFLNFTLQDACGRIERELTMQAFGDTKSRAYWFPLTPLLDETPDPQSLHLREVQDRIDQLLKSVRLFEDDDDVIGGHARPEAAANYLRSKSSVTEGWMISLSYPYELRLDNDEIGEGDGLLMTLGELPPGLSELGECAVVQFEPGSPADWWLRPAICEFSSPRTVDAQSIAAARDRLIALGMNDDDVSLLDQIAARIHDVYANQMASTEHYY